MRRLLGIAGSAGLLASLSVACAAGAQEPRTRAEATRDLLGDWSALGVEVDVTASHTLVYTGPRYVLYTRSGLFVDGSLGLGVTLREVSRDWTTPSGGEPSAWFGQGHAYAGATLLTGLESRDRVLREVPGGPQGGAAGYVYVPSSKVAFRRLVAFGGARVLLGHGPDLSGDQVAPGYLAFAAGIQAMTTWSEVVKRRDGTYTLARGLQGFEVFGLYTPQDSESFNFSKFRHVGGELRYNVTVDEYLYSPVLHLELGIAPGLGPFVGMGFNWLIGSPVLWQTVDPATPRR